MQRRRRTSWQRRGQRPFGRKGSISLKEPRGTVPSAAQRLAGRFDPFHDPYLADPYPFFAQAQAATPVFYRPDLDCWVVTLSPDAAIA
jgi:hypothetical protein